MGEFPLEICVKEIEQGESQCLETRVFSNKSYSHLSSHPFYRWRRLG